jgi:hypothetical protein
VERKYSESRTASYVNATEWELCVLTGIPPGGRPDDLLPDRWLTASAMASEIQNPSPPDAPPWNLIKPDLASIIQEALSLAIADHDD